MGGLCWSVRRTDQPVVSPKINSQWIGQCLCYPMPIVCPGLCYWTHVECIYKSQFLSAYLILHGCDQLVKSKLKNGERLSMAALNTLNAATPATVGCSPSRIFCSTLQKHVGIRKPFLAGFHTRKLLRGGTRTESVPPFTAGTKIKRYKKESSISSNEFAPAATRRFYPPRPVLRSRAS